MERPASSTLPTTPGIYIYKDAQGRIIYVGKARNLRKRILSYFRDASALTPKTVAMIGHAASLETLGDAKLKLGKPEDAKASYAKALRLLETGSPQRQVVEIKLAEVGGSVPSA